MIFQGRFWKWGGVSITLDIRKILLSKIFQAKGDQGNETEAQQGHTIGGVCERLT